MSVTFCPGAIFAGGDDRRVWANATNSQAERMAIDMADPTPDVQALIDQGIQAAQDGDYEAAAESFEQAIDADPANARARYNLALAQQNLGDLEGAVATYLRAIQLDPNLIEAYINLGHLYGELGLDEESLEVFQRAIELDSGNDDLFVALGDVCRDIGFYEDAIQAYRQAEILNPQNTQAQDNLRDVRERVNNQAQRITELEQHLDADPKDPDRYAEVIGAYLEARRYNDAEVKTQQMMQLFPDDPGVFETMALVQEAMGDIDQVVEAWTRVTEIDPDDVDAWEHLGSWRMEQGMVEDAIAAFRRAVELDPNAPSAKFNLAEALLELGQNDEAIAIYRELAGDQFSGMGANELKADAYVGLAEVLNAAEQYDEALKVCDELLEEFPDEPMGLFQKATALDALGRHDEAIQAYISSLETDPLNADTYNDLADTYLKVGDTEHAIEMAEMAIALAPEMDVAYETLAQALRAAGRTDEADEATKQAEALRAALDEADDSE
jgi:tetratricopeptide (TPR) repeat protein